jgi:CBS domain-containing protein
MPTVQDILINKGDAVFSTSSNATVLEAVQKMNQHKLGALVVMEGSQIVGIITERDVMLRIVGEERNSRRTTVGEVMTGKVICCNPHTDLDEISALMQQKRIRHVPICDEDGVLHGMVSIGDVNAYHASHQEARITFLNEYIFGRA